MHTGGQGASHTNGRRHTATERPVLQAARQKTPRPERLPYKRPPGLAGPDCCKTGAAPHGTAGPASPFLEHHASGTKDGRIREFDVDKRGTASKHAPALASGKTAPCKMNTIMRPKGARRTVAVSTSAWRSPARSRPGLHPGKSGPGGRHAGAPALPFSEQARMPKGSLNVHAEIVVYRTVHGGRKKYCQLL